MTDIHSIYYCPRCGEKGDLVLSVQGEKEYSKTQETNKYHCPNCNQFYKIDESNKEFD